MDLTLRLQTVGGWGAHGPAGPLLVVLDGPDYARRASLLRLLRRLVEEDRVPRHRVVLVRADDRFETYSASVPFARALTAALDELTGRGRGRRGGLRSSLRGPSLLPS